jgi:hypothetical protein
MRSRSRAPNNGPMELGARTNFGRAVFTAFTLQTRYLSEQLRRPAVHSVRDTPDEWAFSFLVSEYDSQGKRLLANSDFRVHAAARESWEPRISPVQTPGWPPENVRWTDRMAALFKALYEDPCLATGPLEKFLCHVLDALPASHLGKTVVAEGWNADEVKLRLPHTNFRLGLARTAPRELGWWCFVNGNGVGHSVPETLEKADVRTRLLRLLLDARRP